MTVLDPFPPLQGAIAYAESWETYLNDCQDELSSPRAQAAITRAESRVRIGVMLGEWLPMTWRGLFNALFRPSFRPNLAPWNSIKEYEVFRQQIRTLFFKVREAMDRIQNTAELLQTTTGRKPEGMDRLLTLVDDARRLEEAVFRDWPSFAEPLAPAADLLPVDESLAETLGITVDEARQMIDARRHELNTKRE